MGGRGEGGEGGESGQSVRQAGERKQMSHERETEHT